MSSPGTSVALRARRLVGRVIRRAARPALAGPGSPVQELNERVTHLEGALSGALPAVDDLRRRVDDVAKRIDAVDDRFDVQDGSRAEVITALESVRRRVETLEERVAKRLDSLPYVEGDPFETYDAPGAGRVIGFRGG